MQESLKTKTAKGFLWGGLTNGLQQLFGLVCGVILGRILSPEDNGIVGLVTIFSALSAALTESGFISALSIKKEVSQRDYNAVYWFSIGIGVILYALLYTASPLIADFYKIPALCTLARVSFLNFVISSFGIAHSAYLTRNLLIRQRATATMVGVIAGGIAAIITALFGLGYWALVVQNLSYVLVSMLGFTYFSAFRPSLHIDLSPIRSLFRYSSKLVVTNIFIRLNNNFLTSILGKFFPIAMVGQYNQGNQWNLKGQDFLLSINNSLIQPLMAKIARDDNMRQTQVFQKLLSFVSFITFPLFFGLALVAHDFIVVLIGEKWMIAADYLRIIAIGGAFAVISNVFANYALSQGRSSIYMWNIICFGLLQIILFFVFKGKDLSYLLYAYTALQILWLNSWYFICREQLNYRYRYLFKDVYLYAATATISLLATAMWTDHVSNIYLRLFSSILSMGSLYLLLSFLHSRSIFMEIKSFIFKRA